MKWYVIVGGLAHGTRCVLGDSTFPDNYQVEAVTTRDPNNIGRSHTVAVHQDLLLHRRLPRSSIMYQASEDALHAYILDALFRVVDS